MGETIIVFLFVLAVIIVTFIFITIWIKDDEDR